MKEEKTAREIVNRKTCLKFRNPINNAKIREKTGEIVANSHKK